MKIKFFLMHGGCVDWPVPADLAQPFSFEGFCLKIRADGYFICSDVYIRHDDIGCIGLDRGDGASAFMPPNTTRQ